MNNQKSLAECHEIDLRAGAVNYVKGSCDTPMGRIEDAWHKEWYGYGTDGQGNSWGHFPEETINLHWSVIFCSGLFIGVVLAAVVCLVPW